MKEYGFWSGCFFDSMFGCTKYKKYFASQEADIGPQRTYNLFVLEKLGNACLQVFIGLWVKQNRTNKTKQNKSKVKWGEVKWSEVKWSEVKWSEVKWSEVKWSEVKWSEVKWSEVKWSEVKWSEVKWSEKQKLVNLRDTG